MSDKQQNIQTHINIIRPPEPIIVDERVFSPITTNDTPPVVIVIVTHLNENYNFEIWLKFRYFAVNKNIPEM